MRRQSWNRRAAGVSDYIDLEPILSQCQRMVLHARTAAEVAEHDYRYTPVVPRLHSVFSRPFQAPGLRKNKLFDT
jgi:hypothetical protein